MLAFMRSGYYFFIRLVIVDLISAYTGKRLSNKNYHKKCMPERGGGTGTVLEKSRIALLKNFSVKEVPWSVSCEDCGHSASIKFLEVTKKSNYLNTS